MHILYELYLNFESKHNKLVIKVNELYFLLNNQYIGTLIFIQIIF
jgi:hypothetical protein